MVQLVQLESVVDLGLVPLCFVRMGVCLEKKHMVLSSFSDVHTSQDKILSH